MIYFGQQCKKISDNFLPVSYENIMAKKEWAVRLNKKHSLVKNTYEMQSSNSSDALLMNIFCHPRIDTWKGLRNLFNVNRINPEFGINPEIILKDEQGDKTEIDMAFGDFFIEAKLTEPDFTKKSIRSVKNYKNVENVFNFNHLPNNGKMIFHYQIIRNVLASVQSSKRHILICDNRRGDLIRSYYDVVKCIRDDGNRNKCGIIFWQEICSKIGKELKRFLFDKYGINAC